MNKILNLKTVSFFGLAATVILSLSSCSSKAPYDGRIEGKVKKDEVTLAPKVPGRIIKMNVKEGDHVKAGDTLAIIDVPEIEAKRLQAEGAFEAASGQYEMARNGATSFEREQVVAKLNAAQEQYNLAEKSFKRVKAMVSDSLISMQKYDEVYERYQAAKAQLEATKAVKSDVDHGIRSEKIKMALGDKLRAEGALKEATVAYNERYLLAPKDMSIETVALREGELALPGYNIVMGYEAIGPFLRFTVSEKEITHFTKDSEYKIRLEATQEEFPAKLVAIRQLPGYANLSSEYSRFEVGEAVYELRLIPQGDVDHSKLLSNMTVTMEAPTK